MGVFFKVNDLKDT